MDGLMVAIVVAALIIRRLADDFHSIDFSWSRSN